jgi:hypothetical protein
VEPKLNLSLKLSEPSLEACSNAVTYCMLRTKRRRRVLALSALVFATTYAAAALSEAGQG